MTVRFLAQELYRWTRRVEELQKALAALPEGAEGDPKVRAGLELELRQARKEVEHYRAVLAAKKEKPLI